MTVTLTSTDACGYTGTTGITDSDIAAASWIIQVDTSFTPDEHNTSRGVPADVVRRAWAVVAARIGQSTKAVGDGDGIVSESQGDYSYTVDLSQRDVWVRDPMHGLPRTLLVIAETLTAVLRPGQSVIGATSGYYGWST